MTAKQTRQLWRSLVDEKFRGESAYYQGIIDKLKRLKFAHDKPRHSSCTSDKADNPYCIYCYVQKHFPALLRLFEVKLQAAEIPARKKRTRLEHHPAKHNQLKLQGGNQLDLFH